MPRSARIQPLSDTTTVIGSRSTIASSIAASSCSGACAKLVRRLPSGVFGPKLVRTSLISAATFLHCSSSEPTSALSVLRSARRSLSSLRISISSSLRRLRRRMLRMASACTSVSLKVVISTGLGSSSLRMILMTLSRLRYATMKPPRTSSRCSICLSRWRERRNSTSRRWSSHSRSASARLMTLGTRPFTSTFMLSGMRLSSSVSLNTDSISSTGSTVRARGSMTRRTSSADSSRTSATSGSFLSLSSSPNFSTSRPFCTSQGISVTTI